MYGSQIHNHHIDILKTLKWYKYNSFIEIIKTFPKCRTFILALEKQLHEVFFKQVPIWWHGAKEKILLLKRQIIAQKLKKEQEEREIQELERRRNAHIAKINSVFSSERSNLVSLCNEYKSLSRKC